MLACATTAQAEQAYRPGDRVEVYSSMSGRWEKGTIVNVDGAMGDGRVRYLFQADDKTLASAFAGHDCREYPDRAPGRACVRGPVMNPPPVTAPAGTPARAARASAPSRLAGASAPDGSCAGGSSCGRQRSHRRRRTGTAQARAVLTGRRSARRPDQLFAQQPEQHRCGRTARAGSFIGQYNLMVGGTWSTFSTRDLGGGVTERTLNWNVPAQANVLVINADGSWYL